MPETREQFLDRLYDVAEKAYEGGSMSVAAETIYAQALRDIMYGLTGPSKRYVEQFAKSRGINLTEQEQ